MAGEFGDGLRVEHRAFPLRPTPDLSARFHGTYREEAWARCAAVARDDGLEYKPWPHLDHYPNWSLPALEAAKCAARQGPAAFERLHLALYRALFTESRNIAYPDEVARIAAESGLDTDRFLADYRAGHGRQAVIADYRAAVADGVRSIPTVVVPATGKVLVGLAATADYRAVIEEATR